MAQVPDSPLQKPTPAQVHGIVLWLDGFKTQLAEEAVALLLDVQVFTQL